MRPYRRGSHEVAGDKRRLTKFIEGSAVAVGATAVALGAWWAVEKGESGGLQKSLTAITQVEQSLQQPSPQDQNSLSQVRAEVRTILSDDWEETTDQQAVAGILFLGSAVLATLLATGATFRGDSSISLVRQQEDPPNLPN